MKAILKPQDRVGVYDTFNHILRIVFVLYIDATDI